ncbi:MAG: hypothetical protein PHN88_13460 [Ignavibacteria bacterium]|nr:hypothetical protein [Ignavibacteria bacterium]
MDIDTLRLLFDSLIVKEPEKQFDYLAGIIGASSILFNILTVIFIHQRTHSNSYYDKILDKRINAYGLLSDFIKHLYIRNAIPLPDGGKLRVHRFFLDKDSFDKFKRGFLNVSTYSIWFSEELSVNLNELGNVLFEIQEKFTDSEPNTYPVVGALYHDKLAQHYATLYNLIIKDLITLHKTKKFLKNRNTALNKVLADRFKGNGA